MTPQEIRAKAKEIEEAHYMGDILNIQDGLMAMAKWLQSQPSDACEFAENLFADGWVFIGDGKWVNNMDAKISKDKEHTTAELYKIFKAETEGK